jgi:hypothetical protein
VFAAMAPLLVLAFVLALALPVRPLRTTAHVGADAEPAPGEHSSSGLSTTTPTRRHEEHLP